MGNCTTIDEVQMPAPPRQSFSETYAPSEQEKTTIKLKYYRDKLSSQKHALCQNALLAEYEAKTLIKQGEEDRALFAVKRKNLYDNMGISIENQKTIIEKTVIDVEGRNQLSEYTNVIKDTNDMIKSLETATKLELEIGEDVRQREVELNKLFKKHNVNDAKVSELFKQFEDEVNQGHFSDVYYSNLRQELQQQQRLQQHQRQQQEKQQQEQASLQRQAHKKAKEAESLKYLNLLSSAT